MKIKGSDNFEIMPQVNGVDIVPKNNLSASVAPGASNDNTEGYAIGSLWIDTTADKVYQAVDVSTGAAVWSNLSAAGGGSAEVDMQEASASAETSTASTTFVDLGSVTVTTSNTASKKYNIMFNATFRGPNNATIDIQLVIDGVAQSPTIRTGNTTGTTKPINMGTIGATGLLATGKVIKVQWRTSTGTSFADERCIVIHGVS